MPLPEDSPEREAIDAVNRNSGVYSKAMNDWDESILTTLYTGEALTTLRQDVRDARSANRRSTSNLLSISLTSTVVTHDAARITTREVWTLTENGACSQYTWDEFYDLVVVSGTWLIAKNTWVQVGAAARC